MKTATIPAILFLAACGQVESIPSQPSGTDSAGTLAAKPVPVVAGPDAGEIAPVVNPNVADPNSGTNNQACAPTLDPNAIDPNILASGGNPTCNPIDPNTKDFDYRYGKWTLQLTVCTESNLGHSAADLDYTLDHFNAPIASADQSLPVPVFSTIQDQAGAWSVHPYELDQVAAMVQGVATVEPHSDLMAFRAFPDGTARYIQYTINSMHHGVICNANVVPAR